MLLSKPSRNHANPNRESSRNQLPSWCRPEKKSAVFRLFGRPNCARAKFQFRPMFRLEKPRYVCHRLGARSFARIMLNLTGLSQHCRQPNRQRLAPWCQSEGKSAVFHRPGLMNFAGANILSCLRFRFEMLCRVCRRLVPGTFAPIMLNQSGLSLHCRQSNHP